MELFLLFGSGWQEERKRKYTNHECLFPFLQELVEGFIFVLNLGKMLFSLFCPFFIKIRFYDYFYYYILYFNIYNEKKIRD